MKLTIHAAPFYAPKKQDIVSETIPESRILDRPERLGPYRSTEEFLSWFKNNEPTLDVITQYPEILNLVGEMVNQGKIDTADVTVILYTEDGSKIMCKYTTEGYLDENWLFGIMEGHYLSELVKEL